MTITTPISSEEGWSFQWKQLYEEVITSGLCTGCAGCVIVCPHDVIGYKHEPGAYVPFHLEDELGITDCSHGFGNAKGKGCTECTKACPRFRSWETEADVHLHGRTRKDDEMSGIYSDILLVRASEEFVYDIGQDGGLVSAMLIWCLENDIIDGALTSGVENLPDGSSGWKAIPMVATNREEVLRGAGSRYTYSANTMAYDEAKSAGLQNLGLVGMSCQTSVAPVMWHRGASKPVSRRIKLNIGLLCSKSFDDAMFDELFGVKYGLKKQDIAKMNIKGVFQIWMKNGNYHEINLKECHAWTRTGCTHCPDFAAEHADISTGGIGNVTDWTLTIVRTDLGRAIIKAMIDDGTIETRPGDDDPAAIALMHRLAATSRKRWPNWANNEAAVGL